MKGVQCYELFGGIAHKNLVFFISFLNVTSELTAACCCNMYYVYIYIYIYIYTFSNNVHQEWIEVPLKLMQRQTERER